MTSISLRKHFVKSKHGSVIDRDHSNLFIDKGSRIVIHLGALPVDSLLKVTCLSQMHRRHKEDGVYQGLFNSATNIKYYTRLQ